MTRDLQGLVSGELLDDERELSLAELCRLCRISVEMVERLVMEGIVEPRGGDPAHWRFTALNLYRARCALRLERDLGVNLAGAALALDLLEQIETMRARLSRFGE